MPRRSDQHDPDDRWTDAEPTTILLSRAGEEWRATQRGVAVEGSGPTAPLAAARYCRLVAADADEGASTAAESADAIGDAAPESAVERRESATRS